MKIEWRPVDGFSRYEVCNLGYLRTTKGRIINGSTTEGYITLTLLDDNGIRRPLRMHRLVCLAFHGLPPDELHTDVNHKDGIKSNNLWTNLEWATASANKHHASENGLVKATMRIQLTDITDGSVRILNSLKAVGREFGLTKAQTYSMLIRDELYMKRFKFEVLKPGTTNQAKKVGIYGCRISDNTLVRANSIYEMSLFMKVGENPIRRAMKKDRLVNGCYFWITENPDWAQRLSHFSEKDIAKSIREHANRQEAMLSSNGTFR